MFQKIIKEPLFQFGLIGALLFFVFIWVNPDTVDNRIIIDEYDISEISSKWNMQWKRDPSPKELKGLLDNHIKQEIYYREALAMNLDHNDEIIKRRLAQKMQFLTQDLVEKVDPSNAELLNYLEENQEKYIKETEVSFSHKYFNRDLRNDAQSDAINALSNAKLNGDYSPVKNSFERAPLSRIRAELGSDFAVAISKLKSSEEWQGPVKSGFGYHIVLISNIFPGEPYALDEIRSRVKNDFHYDMINEMNDELFNSLLEKYEVVLKFEEGK
ncbi:MAG: peptidyl-prolyl cis-trans isomerase [Reichenbachiella sp.]